MMDWFEVVNADEVPSPALLFFPQRIDANLRAMVGIAGSPGRLRPHVKTHKLPQLVRRQLGVGIRKFKAATVAEAAMAAHSGAEDILLAYQPVGPGVGQFLTLALRFPGVRLSCLVDDASAMRALSEGAARANTRVPVYLDLNVGQDRTGVDPRSPAAAALYTQIARSPGLAAAGLHVYDGHIGDTDLAVRTQRCDDSFALVTDFKSRLEAAGLPVAPVVAGGSPTFPVHARREAVDLSPGTPVLWDAGYAQKLPDLPFLPAAALLTRVVSKPLRGRLCLDLGHKAVASEMPHPRVQFLNLPGARPVAHSEEHLVVETPDAEERAVGDVVYAIPWHVCPTVALHELVWVVEGGLASENWAVAGRGRRVEPWLRDVSGPAAGPRAPSGAR